MAITPTPASSEAEIEDFEMWSEVGLWVLRVRSGIRWRNGEWRVNGVVLRRNLAVGIVEKEESDMADRGERRCT